MRIGIQAWGSEGDLRPFLALGGALAERGHDVTAVLTDLDDRTYEAYERQPGLRVRMVVRPGPDRRAELDRIARELLRRNALEQARLITTDLFQPAVPAMFDAARQLCSQSDLVIGHYFLHPLRAAAEAAGVPEVSVTFSADVIPSRTYPPTGIPSWGPLWNLFWWRLAGRVIDRAFLGSVNDLRASLGLSPLKCMWDAWHSRLLDLVTVSPALCPPPADWDPGRRMTGFLAVPAEREVDEVPERVERFLRAGGDPPVFVGFGSLTPKEGSERDRLRRIVEEALGAARCRGIVQGLAPDEASTPTLLHVRRVPHVAVFPRCLAVVHHGGAGTTHSAVRAGVPSVVVPHVADQAFWAGLLYRRGVASRPLPRLKLTPKALSARIREAIAPRVRATARTLQSRVALENGPREAVRLIEELRPARPR